MYSSELTAVHGVHYPTTPKKQDSAVQQLPFVAVTRKRLIQHKQRCNEMTKNQHQKRLEQKLAQKRHHEQHMKVYGIECQNPQQRLRESQAWAKGMETQARERATAELESRWYRLYPVATSPTRKNHRCEKTKLQQELEARIARESKVELMLTKARAKLNHDMGITYVKGSYILKTTTCAKNLSPEKEPSQPWAPGPYLNSFLYVKNAHEPMRLFRS